LCSGLDLLDTSLSFHWDPGGAKLIHRLGGKLKLKKGGNVSIHLGLTVAAHMKLVTHIAADTNLNSDMLLISKLRNMVLPSKTDHLPWDLGGSELVVCIVQWQCSVLVNLHHPSSLGTAATKMEVYIERLVGKPLLKEWRMSGTSIRWTSTSYDRSYIPERRKHQGASNKYQKPSLSYLLFIFLLKYLPLMYPESHTVLLLVYLLDLVLAAFPNSLLRLYRTS
jgi:hypothetical protein